MKNMREERVMKPVVYQTVCDGCGKTVEGEPPEGWTDFSSHHSDWGNDSVDTHQDYDVCSWACYLTVVRRVFEDYETLWPERTLEVDGKDWHFIRGLLEGSG